MVYVSNAGEGSLSALELDARTGTLKPFQRVSLGGNIMPLALAPDRRYLYAARRSEPLAVTSLAIDTAGGGLVMLGEALLPESMAFISTDRTGRFLFSASYAGHLVCVSPIASDGHVGSVQQVVRTKPNAHAILADASNRWVFATSLGGGIVLQMAFDVSTGRLTPNDEAAMRPHLRASPRHFVFSSDSRFVYVINELDATIDVLAFDVAAGTLRPLQNLDMLGSDFKGAPWAADLHLTPDGRFLYGSDRRSNTLVALRVHEATGLLTLIGRVTTQAQPRSFAITPDGAFLIVAGQLSNHVGVYAIDAGSGALSECSVLAVGLGPCWVECLQLDG